MTIEYYKKDVYGKTLLYIKDPGTAKNIYLLTGKKTIDEIDMDVLSILGCKFVQVLP